MDSKGYSRDDSTMHTGPPDRFLLAVCDYSTLEDADRKAGGQHGEEWLINLQNHMIWGSFAPDVESGPVVQGAILHVMEALGVSTPPHWAAEMLAAEFHP